jgi:hypothetical protein
VRPVFTGRVSRLAIRAAAAALSLSASIVILACGADPSRAPARQLIWQPAKPAPGIADLAGPRSDGRIVAAVSQGLSLFGRGTLTPFAFSGGPGSYTPGAGEPYIALTPNVRLPRAHCSFRRDEVFAIAAGQVVRINRAGVSSTFASVPGPFLGGIGFDRVGTFGHRLLVISTANQRSSLYAIDCGGRVSPVVVNGPLVEGGIEVAPRSFGRFGGRLIAVDEMGGGVYAFNRNGHAARVASPGLPTGGDVGVEAIGFVPPGKHGPAFLADRGVPGNPHPGTDSILAVSASAVDAAHLRAGDLLIATEGGAETVAIRCQRRRCAVRRVGSGPDVAHAEGNIVFRGG